MPVSSASAPVLDILYVSNVLKVISSACAFIWLLSQVTETQIEQSSEWFYVWVHDCPSLLYTDVRYEETRRKEAQMLDIRNYNTPSCPVVPSILRTPDPTTLSLNFWA